jgi:DNA polymerase I
MPPILYLIDGHALAYRTFFALTAGGGGERLTTSSGEPTAGVFGFASVILRLLEQERPEYLAVAFDAGHSFRDKVYKDYKATRAKMPDDLSVQMKRIRQLVDAFCFPRLEVENYEADDVLGSIARQAAEKGMGVKIITGDRDLLQLVDDRILVNLAGKKLSEASDYTSAGVFEYLGVYPEQVVDYKALVGDTSDNIPGVAGIGNKTAISLLGTYKTLDEVYAHLGDLSAGARNKLEVGRESAYLSQRLARIQTDVQITLDLEKARTTHINMSALETLFRELEFRALNERLKKIVAGFLPGAGAAAAGAAAGPGLMPGGQMSLFGQEVTRIGEPPAYQLDVQVVDTAEKLADLAARLAEADTIALDTETTSTDPLRASLVGISLAVKEGEGFYIPVGHITGDPQLPLEDVIRAIGGALSNPKKAKVGHNLKYDVMVLERAGIHTHPLTFDTMIAEWLVNPASHNLGLKSMADYYLAIAMTHIEELIGRGKAQITMDQVPVASAAPYAAADAEVSLRLQPLLQKRLEEQNAHHLLHTLEMPLIPVLQQMEENGVALDIPFLQGMAGELNERLVAIEQQIYDQVGYSFNINSTQQLSKVLFEALKLDPPDRRKKTSSGHYSTSADVLEDMRGQHPVVDLVLEYRELAKLKSTYVEALPLEVNPKTGRVHTIFNQTGSVTGRLASSEPNLQNIPTRTDLGRRVRHAFVAGDGNVLLSVDYSQVELRIVAHMSGDEAMLAAFQAGQDIHAATAAAIYNVPLNKVSKEQRRNAKSINFGLIYGISAFGLARYAGVTLAEAENFSAAYFRQFPGVKSYLDGLRRLAASQGYVETLLGRRRYFPNLRDQSNFNLRNREEREAINAPIQGSAADIMKLAMIRLKEALDADHLAARLLLQVHDELLLECSLEELQPTARVVRAVMENAYPLSVPLATEARWGKNWEELQPMMPESKP